MKFRDATQTDLPAIVALLADDKLGATREIVSNPVADVYVLAFDEILAQDGNRIILAVDHDDSVAACLQLTVTPGLARVGVKRATIEAVRVRADHRGTGLGTTLFEHAIKAASLAGCQLVQLTTDKQRPDAKRFYERLGFEASHEGMKLKLGS